MVVFISITWGVCTFIYNMSMINTATQLSAQAGLVTYDRTTYRGFDVDGSYGRALIRGRQAAYSVYKENTCGMLPDQATGTIPDLGCGEPTPEDPPGGSAGFYFGNGYAIFFRCADAAPLFDGTSDLFNYRTDNCAGRGSAAASGLQVTARSGNINMPLSFLTVGPGGLLDTGTTTDQRQISSSSSAYSFVAPGGP